MQAYHRLSLLQKLEVGSRKSEVGSRKSEIGSRKSEIGSRKLEVRSRKSEVGRPSSAKHNAQTTSCSRYKDVGKVLRNRQHLLPSRILYYFNRKYRFSMVIYRQPV